MDYKERHEQYRMRCDAALGQAIKAVFQPGSQVSAAAEYALLNGGKRVRGVLVQAVSDMLNGSVKAADAFSAAIEMIHAFSLVHDDLPCMDDDDMRRGKPSTHIAFGEATALLGGDLLAIQAFEVAALAEAEAPVVVRAVALLANASGAKGMIYGQELDLAYEEKEADEEILGKIHLHKTGALIRASAQLGVLAAAQDPRAHGAITTYAEKIGLVFQIVDDVLDVTADEAQLGKPVGSDKEQGKTTFVTLFGLEKAATQIKKLTDDAVAALQETYGEKAAFLCEFARWLAGRVK